MLELLKRASDREAVEVKPKSDWDCASFLRLTLWRRASELQDAKKRKVSALREMRGERDDWH